MNKIVKYGNYMNNLKFSGFTSVDYNFLMVLCSKLRGQKTEEVVVSFDELRENTGYTQHNAKQFISDIMRMNNKLMKMNCVLENNGTIYQFVLFHTFATDTVRKQLVVAVNKNFQFILNELAKNFTRFELNEFVNLDSKYAKSLYRLLKQFKNTGKYEVSIDDFRYRVDCPVSYTNKHVMDKIIKPALNELRCYFQNLKCKPKYACKRGNPVIGYLFTFTPQKDVQKPEGSQGKRKMEGQANRKMDSYKSFPQRGYDYKGLEKEMLQNFLNGSKILAEDGMGGGQEDGIAD